MRLDFSSSLLNTVLSLMALGGFSDLRGSIYSLTPSEQLFVSLSNTLTFSGGSTIHGDVGVSSSVNVSSGSLVAYPPFTGTAYFSGAVNCTGCTGTIAGGAVANSTNVSTAISNYTSLITTLEALTGGTNLGATFSGGTLAPGLYDTGTLKLGNQADLTLDAGGDPTAQFVLRISSNINLGGSPSVNLINGAQPDNVILLFTGSGNINWSSSGNFAGILLDGDTSPTHNLSFATGPSSVGRVIYPVGDIRFVGGGLFQLFQPGGVPEPSTVGLVGLGLAIVAFKLLAARTARGRDG